jgi:excisionase family DNA binding protein
MPTTDNAINIAPGCATDDPPPLTVTIPIARRLSGLGNTTLWKLIGDGTLATVRVGRRRLISYESLQRLLTPSDRVATQAPRRRGRPRKPSVSEATP